MITLVDGPMEGSYAVKRAPLYLRAVLDTQTGEKDVLDQLTDSPTAFEEVWVYKLEGEAGMVHLNFGSGRSGRRTGFYATGTYHHLPNVVGGELRSEMAWRTWVAAQVPGVIDMATGQLL